MEAEGPITCLAASVRLPFTDSVTGFSSVYLLWPQNDSWFAGSTDSNLRTYVKGEHDMSGIVTACPGGDAVRSVAVDPHSKRIAVTSEYVGLRVSYECSHFHVTVIKGSRLLISKISKRLYYWRVIRGA